MVCTVLPLASFVGGMGTRSRWWTEEVRFGAGKKMER
ncbi:hypothetical protein COLO4_34114 [Corchorus olitorius]|uniref:Uncharacterized protein n=1 Tax=Corchorus olitorius TaxID=93759 RepID=A0A1R3GNS2_9ROSI|nr:hypothetical protein COLO4_34114 [Corchorus olitorius]